MATDSTALIKRYDLRHLRDLKHKARVRGGVPTLRDPKTITGLTGHQAAKLFAIARYQIQAAGGDIRLAKAKRALETACHSMAFATGEYVIAAPFRLWVEHGNGLNPTDLGMEVDGAWAGLADDPTTTPREDIKTTWGGKPSPITDLAIETARACLLATVELAWEEGCPIEFLNLHRQSSGDRRADPGETLTKEVYTWGAAKLRLKMRPWMTWPKSTPRAKDGSPIPRQWHPDGVGDY